MVGPCLGAQEKFTEKIHVRINKSSIPVPSTSPPHIHFGFMFYIEVEMIKCDPKSQDFPDH